MIMKKINSILSPSCVQPVTRCAMACLVVLSVAALDCHAAAMIDVKGNGNLIANGSLTPSGTNGTDFSTAEMYGGSTISTFTIDNTGTAQLNLTGTPIVAITGTNAGDFVVTALPSTPLAATNGTTTFTVTFMPMPGPPGTRSATISIASDDSTNNPYTFAIQGTSALSTNANLSDLTISVGTLNPTFASGTLGYSAYISDTNTSITVTPTTANAGAMVTVNGTPVASGTGLTITISPGPNPVMVVVTPQSGTPTKMYTITVNSVHQDPTVTTAANASITYSTSAQFVSLTATVTSGVGTVNQGEVMFQVKDGGGNPVCSPVMGSVDATGKATAGYMLPGSVVPGIYTIEATFFNAMAFLDSSDFTNKLTITPATTTTTAASTSASYSSQSQNVSLAALVNTGDGGVVGEGTVTFQLLDTSLKPVGSPVTSPPIAAGSGNASAMYVLPAGTELGLYGIVATFNATSNFASSMNSTQKLSLGSAASTTSVAAIDTAFNAADHSIELRATVSVPGESVNEGTVSFQVFNGGTPFGAPIVSPTVGNGTAAVSFVVPGGTPLGSYGIVAVYSGSAHFSISSDNAPALDINPAEQIITSPLAVSGVVGVAFSYNLTTSKALVVYDASGLPAGLHFNPQTALITGIPVTPGTTYATITATEAGGTDSETLEIAITPNQAPVIADFSTEDNPALINTPVNYSFTVTDDDSPMLSYTFNFGDGTPVLTGTFAQGTPVTVSHAYAAYTDGVPITLTVTDGFTPVVQTDLLSVPMPDSGGDDVPNIGEDAPPVVEPLDGLSVEVTNSDGGIIQLGIDVNSLTRGAYDVSTDWGDVSGRSSTVKGTHPVHLFQHHGIFVAKSTAANKTTHAVAGTARITLVLSTDETGETAPNATSAAIKASALALAKTVDTGIKTKMIKGKFSFSAKVKDTVTYNGTIKLPAGYDPFVAHEFWVGLGNIVVETNIDNHGKGAAPGTPAVLKTLKISTKIKKGHVAVGGEDARINVTYYSQAMVSSGFDTEGISQQSQDVSKGKSAPRNIQVAMLLDGVPFQDLAPVDFSVSNNMDFGNISGRSGK